MTVNVHKVLLSLIPSLPFTPSSHLSLSPPHPISPSHPLIPSLPLTPSSHLSLSPPHPISPSHRARERWLKPMLQEHAQYSRLLHQMRCLTWQSGCLFLFHHCSANTTNNLLLRVVIPYDVDAYDEIYLQWTD